MYIQIEGCIFSYPEVREDSSPLLEQSINSEPSSVGEIYEEVWTANSTVINFSGNDLATDTRHVVKVAHPLYNQTSGQIGAIIWEIDINQVFNQAILPSTFGQQKLSFIQYRTPEHVKSVNQDEINTQCSNLENYSDNFDVSEIQSFEEGKLEAKQKSLIEIDQALVEQSARGFTVFETTNFQSFDPNCDLVF